ncbi:phenylalanine--tRNA ligase subunit alpha [Candidatus Uhrbacteria bacterium]|nr:phenylalanine--tRNA ligase subunit alpha [Candidatus Uhrbacteria bacterium]
MQDQLNALRLEVETAIGAAKTSADLDAAETKFLGRKGALTDLLKQLSTLSAEERPKMGALANDVKRQLEMMIASRRKQLGEEQYSQLSLTERVDVTEPGARPPQGHLHPMTKAINEITEIFERIGFVRTRYPEVDWDFYAFESLNMPKDHPARDEWETFFMDAPVSKKGKMVLTPHTSNSQVRELERKEFPVRMINIAKCYRRQSDATHVPMFHQFEGLYVDKGVSISHLRGVLDYFAGEFFGPDRKTRLRPFHFRFTEPSFEIDITCGVCGGTGISAEKQKCKMCKRGWLELGGAGMVHPNVLKAGGVDPKKYSGFAFGWGVERTYSMKGGLNLDDIRILYKNDLRFLKQF